VPGVEFTSQTLRFSQNCIPQKRRTTSFNEACNLKQAKNYKSNQRRLLLEVCSIPSRRSAASPIRRMTKK
jgi:hypothetical protein